MRGPDGKMQFGNLGMNGSDLTQQDFATLLGVSLATVRKWERGTGEPSGAAKTLLAVARLHPEVIREALALRR